jgi:hypothetical protein
MVYTYDVASGRWSGDEGEDDGPGRGGCRRPAEPLSQHARPALRLELMPVAFGAVPDGRSPGPRYGR